MTFKDDCIEEFIELFHEVQPLIKNFEGCKQVSLLKDVNDKKIMMTYSIWESENNLNHYRYSEFFKETWTRTKKLFLEKAQARSLEMIDKIWINSLIPSSFNQ